MNRKNIRIETLVRKFLNGQTSVEEQKELSAWYNQNQDTPIDIPEEFEVSEERLRNRILNSINAEITDSRPKTWRPRIAIAAAIAAMIVSTGIWFSKPKTLTHTEQMSAVSDVPPGKQGATLTLADGREIHLTQTKDGELVKDAGVVIAKSDDGLVYTTESQESESSHLNTLSTANGETYQVRLPDGSRVWLNSASSLSYTTRLIEKGKRVVRLRGEAYFEVAKNHAHPFIVESKGQQVEVLGTEFTINAYDNEHAITTTLLEGSVRLNAWGQQKVLKPGEQALNSSDGVRIEEANIENVTDWKNGDFYFNRIDFKTAMRKIERWYNVQMIYDSSIPENLETGGWISRNKSLASVLSFIESSGLVRFKIEGKKVYVFK